MKRLIAASLLILNTHVYAEDLFPAACKPLVVPEGAFVLRAEKSSLFMIHNLSSLDVWITHPISASSASAGWSSRLQAGHWSALMIDQKKFELSCIESRPGHEQQIPCAGVLTVCEWSSVGAPQGQKGAFWAGEDMALEPLLDYLGTRGYVLPTLKNNDRLNTGT